MSESHEHEATPGARRSARVRATLLAAGAAMGMTLAGFGVAAAQSDDAPPPEPGGTSAPSEDSADTKRFARGGRGPGHKGLRMGGIHGEFTTRAPGGGYQTVATQKGEVTAVSAESLTVKSEDGFSRTYVVDDGTLVNAGNDGIADVAKGDEVHVTAIVEEGGRARAVQVRDGTRIRESRARWVPTP